jgi:hypothetical protein
MRRVGPELKMPEMKVPPFLYDLFFDLRERGLLPIVALVVVAIVAAPIVLGSGSEEQEEPVTPAAVATGGTIGGPSGGGRSLAVVQLKPGLREYRKRLAHRKPTDPFKQRYTAPIIKGATLKPITSPTTSTSTTTTTTEGPSSESPTTTPPAGQPGGSPVVNPGEVVYFAIAVDVQISRAATKEDGSKEKSGPTVHKRVLPYTVLPSEKAQVVTYMGVSPKTRKPLFLVSTAVTAEFGEWKCLSGVETCQLLEVEPGFPETFAYGQNGARYKINVLKVERVVTGHERLGSGHS